MPTNADKAAFEAFIALGETEIPALVVEASEEDGYHHELPSRIQDRNQVHWDRTDFKIVVNHAAPRKGARFVNSTKASMAPNR